jgi:hypothetical protein
VQFHFCICGRFLFGEIAMPYKLSSDKLSVLKEDGTLVKKHDTPKEAQAHLAALEANVEDAKHVKIGAAISQANMKKVQAAHDAMVEMGAACGNGEKSMPLGKFMKMYAIGGIDYARSEGWDIQSAAGALSQVAYLVSSEVEESDISKIATILRGLVDFIRGEIDEMENSALLGQQQSKSFAIPKHKDLNLSYVKSIGLDSTKSMAVKYLSRDEIKGYTFLWGSPKLTDVEIEYFTTDTDFWDSTLGKSVRPLTWDHAQDANFKASPIIGNITDFGDDELGRWYVAKLDTSHKYKEVIRQLIKDGALGTSSDSAPQYVVREQTGKSTWLKQWPWFASALTNTPAEPRMIDSLEFLKSLGVQLPDANENHLRFEHKKRQAELLKLKYHFER